MAKICPKFFANPLLIFAQEEPINSFSSYSTKFRFGDKSTFLKCATSFTTLLKVKSFSRVNRVLHVRQDNF